MGRWSRPTSHIGDELQAELEIVFAHLNGEFREQESSIEPRMLLHMMRVLRVFEVGHAADGGPLAEPVLAESEAAGPGGWSGFKG